MSLNDFKKYQSWYDEAGAGSYPYIQLYPAPKVSVGVIQPEPKAPDTTATLAKPSDPRAAELIDQAGQSVRALDLDQARKLLDQAAAISPTQPRLWVSYAAVAELLGMKNQELEDIQRELVYHPEEVQFYEPIAKTLLAAGESTEALAMLRTWVRQAPDSAPAAIALARELQALKFPDQALDAANAALERLKSGDADLTSLRLIAARSQVDLGKPAEAAEAAASLLPAASDPD